MRSFLKSHSRTYSAGINEDNPASNHKHRLSDTTGLRISQVSYNSNNNIVIGPSSGPTSTGTYTVSSSSSVTSLKKLNPIHYIRKASGGYDDYNNHHHRRHSVGSNNGFISIEDYKDAGVIYGTRTHEWGTFRSKNDKIQCNTNDSGASSSPSSAQNESPTTGGMFNEFSSPITVVPEDYDEDEDIEEDKQGQNDGEEEGDGVDGADPDVDESSKFNVESHSDQIESRNPSTPSLKSKLPSISDHTTDDDTAESIFSFQETDDKIGRNSSINYYKKPKSSQGTTSYLTENFYDSYSENSVCFDENGDYYDDIDEIDDNDFLHNNRFTEELEDEDEDEDEELDTPVEAVARGLPAELRPISPLRVNKSTQTSPTSENSLTIPTIETDSNQSLEEVLDDSIEDALTHSPTATTSFPTSLLEQGGYSSSPSPSPYYYYFQHTPYTNNFQQDIDGRDYDGDYEDDEDSDYYNSLLDEANAVTDMYYDEENGATGASISAKPAGSFYRSYVEYRRRRNLNGKEQALKFSGSEGKRDGLGRRNSSVIRLRDNTITLFGRSSSETSSASTRSSTKSSSKSSIKSLPSPNSPIEEAVIATVPLIAKPQPPDESTSSVFKHSTDPSCLTSFPDVGDLPLPSLRFEADDSVLSPISERSFDSDTVVSC